MIATRTLETDVCVSVALALGTVTLVSSTVFAELSPVVLLTITLVLLTTVGYTSITDCERRFTDCYR